MKHSHDHDNLNREGQSLVGLVDTDQNHVTETLEDANRRWENLSQGTVYSMYCMCLFLNRGVFHVKSPDIDNQF